MRERQPPIISCESPTYVSQVTTNDSPRDDDGPERGGSISSVRTTFPATELTCWTVDDRTKARLLSNFRQCVLDDDEIRENRNCPFPGPQPVSVDSSHFCHFTPGTYVVAAKHDGVRAGMFCCDVDGRHMVCLFDRKVSEPYIVYVHRVPKTFYQGFGTVIDGELIYDNQLCKWTFVAFDVVVLGSFPQFHKAFDERMRVLRVALRSYSEDVKDTVRIVRKTFVPLEDAKEDELRSPAFASDGYVFMPRQEGVRFGHHARFFKLKTCHSVDFMYKNRALFIYNQGTKRYVKGGTLDVDPATDLPEGTILECVLVQHDRVPSKRRWKMLHARPDKSTSNTLYVMDKTLLNIQEALTFDTLQRLALPTE